MLKEVVTDVFFDLDHTLWDFETNSALTFRKIFKANLIELDLDKFLEFYRPLNLEYWKMYRENLISKPDLRYQRLRRAFDHFEYPVSDETIGLLSVQYIEHLSSHNNLIENSVQILEYLKPKYKMHIITNGFREVQSRKLASARIDQFFDTVVNSEEAGVKKPHPHIFNLALERAGIEAGKGVMIGDNIEADILGAKSVGMHTIHYNAHKDPEHDHCSMIHDLLEIKSLL